MANPQNELYKMLAESSLRMKHIASMHKTSHDSIAKQQQTIMLQILEMRAKIQGAGVGADPEAEDRYMQLLEDYDRLDQSFDLGLQFHSASHNVKPDQEEIPQEFQKAIAYGAMLADIYKDGALIKGASIDLQYWGEYLIRLGYNRSIQVGEKLLNLC